ncbi:unnamed protein product [Cyclocybe aegerita]|uniref:Uncharacterized protein n=1 Tax=Cyclocybe aegerita TaxID=1973307 RepID=A0A8S0VYR1_CYCAE|nr:unnamed protein product [Cyclocybe aegerita]
MPLFGSKHKHDQDVTRTVVDDTSGGRHHNTVGANPATHTTTGVNQAYPEQGYGGQTDFSGQPGYGQSTHAQGQPGLMGSNAPGQHGYVADDRYSTGAHTGAHTGTNTGTHGSAIPPSGEVHHGKSSTGGAGQRLTGKVESAVGTLVGSNALKQKGLQKEQEANAVKLQGRELSEAERLEREALMRRERAVAHGAHPANATLGAGTNQGVTGGGYT